VSDAHADFLRQEGTVGGCGAVVGNEGELRTSGVLHRIDGEMIVRKGAVGADGHGTRLRLGLLEYLLKTAELVVDGDDVRVDDVHPDRHERLGVGCVRYLTRRL